MVIISFFCSVLFSTLYVHKWNQWTLTEEGYCYTEGGICCGLPAEDCLHGYAQSEDSWGFGIRASIALAATLYVRFLWRHLESFKATITFFLYVNNKQAKMFLPNDDWAFSWNVSKLFSENNLQISMTWWRFSTSIICLNMYKLCTSGKIVYGLHNQICGLFLLIALSIL